MSASATRRDLLRGVALGSGGLVLGARGAAAQAPYPSRAVRLLVGSAPGGATDITARILAEAMTEAFPRGIAVESRTGAGGNIAAETCARAAPDGYTLLINDAAMMAINPVLYANVPFDPAQDFAPIAHLAEFPFVFVVTPDVPARNMTEFAAWARAQPDPVLFASPNPGSQHHLGMEIVAQRMGFRVTHVGFRGGGPATAALLGRQMQVGSIGLPPLVPHLRAGTLRALAVSTATRSPLAPDVPTLGQAGLEGQELAVWYGLVGPRGLPAEVVRHVSQAAQGALARPEALQKLASQGLTARYMPPEAFDRFMASERASWGTAARAANVTIR
ncbi:Bug family tripartite tricarboxylate transporter substrate binding protein [Falsiroseomonas selenitidurans]|uniref:Tripartite tricarboxylate transporter substrate binding protein n=1 Tax=Falsiroseomonas selenitidurans TaxID=2716335 RepID=A0ABX1DZK9_9PROT|nr:tripartite tricarboxylate transporter substrate binding protein [Falsiroseomonas selenitidurans]NKC30324.1 tripartite tricarboxylate transporter substrate binding protein [Falsiroseomonas selenitidurans]